MGAARLMEAQSALQASLAKQKEAAAVEKTAAAAAAREAEAAAERGLREATAAISDIAKERTAEQEKQVTHPRRSRSKP